MAGSTSAVCLILLIFKRDTACPACSFPAAVHVDAPDHSKGSEPAAKVRQVTARSPAVVCDGGLRLRRPRRYGTVSAHRMDAR